MRKREKERGTGEYEQTNTKWKSKNVPRHLFLIFSIIFVLSFFYKEIMNLPRTSPWCEILSMTKNIG